MELYSRYLQTICIRMSPFFFLKNMPSSSIEYVLDEVKNIVHKCLTEQFEEIPNEKVKKKGNRKRRQKDHLSMEYE